MAIPQTRSAYVYTTPPAYINISGKVIPALPNSRCVRAEDVALLQEMAQERVVVPAHGGTVAPSPTEATVLLGPHSYDIRTRAVWWVLSNCCKSTDLGFFCNSSWTLAPTQKQSTIAEQTAIFKVDAPLLDATEDSVFGPGYCLSISRLKNIYSAIDSLKRYYYAELPYRSEVPIDHVTVAEDGTTTHTAATAKEPLYFYRQLSYHDSAVHTSRIYDVSTSNPVLLFPSAWACGQGMVTGAWTCYQVNCDLSVYDGSTRIKHYTATLIWYATPTVAADGVTLAAITESNIYSGIIVYCRDTLKWPTDTLTEADGRSSVFTAKSSSGVQVIDYAFKTALP